MSLPKPLVSVEWLAENLDNPNLVILNATIKKATDKSSTSVNEVPQIKNARFFDIKNVFSDITSGLPNTFPSAEQFEHEAQRLGINNDSLIVVYDVYGFYSCARAWWLLKSFGHTNVAVLDGGLPTWNAQKYPVESQKEYSGTQGNFKANYQNDSIKDYNEVLVKTKDTNTVIIDARATNRFTGEVEEPRAGLRSGHIPNSKSLPFSQLIKDGKLMNDEELTEKFKTYANKELIFTCGSGVTACILALGAEKAGLKNISVYDGSWTEWGSREELPIEVGEV